MPITPAITGPMAMPMRTRKSTPCAADSRSTSSRQAERHARKPAQMIVLRQADSGHRHIAVADGLDLLHAVARGQAVELGDDLVEQRDRARRAELLRELGEADKIAEQDGGLGDAVGDPLVRPFLQPLGDGRRQDVGEQRVGLGPRLVGHGEGVAHDQRDDAEGGDGGGDIEIGEQARLGGEQRALLRVRGTRSRGAARGRPRSPRPRGGSGTCRRWRRRPPRR